MVRAEALHVSLTDAYAHCRAITKQRARNFYFAFLSLPAQKRLAVYAVYAFCRTCDDYADDGRDASTKVALLEDYRNRLDACFQGRPDGPVFVALGDVAQRYHVPKELFEEIITGVRMDITIGHYATFNDLYTYCYRVAAVVGLITIEIFGYQDSRAKQYAIDLGIGMQLVNILRDIPEDAACDRIYLPQEDLKLFGYGETELQAGVVNGPFGALMGFEAARARTYFEKGAALVPLISRDARACPAILGGLYLRLLERIEAKRWNVFGGRISIPTSEKVWLAMRLWTSAAVRGTRPAQG